ncbi:hypothetical protein [Exiguobacterium sp. AT1b]|uniref:Uncharacterized protein n=1 Tax=Exiguobacterium sp. (strain ATCC BAA-1283 / AT1b) TaxID=360911 RepID=C4L145_EXISA|nr:hypothetical protein [Exiguobacterium sp. AT1b]ACQ68991.1 hypothetical protein EAT1b_0056 [Exiguobacterium sp. AT1b]
MEQNEQQEIIETQPQKTTFKERIKDPVILAGATGLMYQGYQYLARQHGLPEIQLGDFQTLVDVLSFSLLGVSVYHLKK